MSIGAVRRDASTAEFFEGASLGQFLIRRCAGEDHVSPPRAKRCQVCGSPDLRSVPASGRARLVSWAVVPLPAPEGSAQPDPVVPAIAELEEGLWWWSALVGADPSSLREGTPLRIDFERPEEGEAIPVFRVEPA